jgi:hypothetical protein
MDTIFPIAASETPPATRSHQLAALGYSPDGVAIPISISRGTLSETPPLAPQRRFPPWAVAIILIGAGLAVCGPRTMSIGNLLADPERYEGQPVRVEGEVSSDGGFLGYGAYQVDDGTGSVAVITRKSSAPQAGAYVIVDGTFRPALMLGAQSLAVIEETSRGVR